MSRFAIWTCVSAIFCLSCSSANKGFSARDLTLVAWNEDTISPVIFKIFANKNFTYSIKKNGLVELWKGKILVSEDTIYLDYENGRVPPGLGTFLIEGAPGNYLIQLSPPASKRIVMRIIHPTQSAWHTK